LNDEVAIAASLEKEYGKNVVTSDSSGKHCEGRYGLDVTEVMNGSVNAKIYSDKTMNVCATESLCEKRGDLARKKGIRIISITAKWNEDLTENTLTDVSLDVKSGELVAVIGPVGSGKVNCICTITYFSAILYQLQKLCSIRCVQ
jgi:ABC-type multidrug transport system fused ATPase/permease subunit